MIHKGVPFSRNVLTLPVAGCCDYCGFSWGTSINITAGAHVSELPLHYDTFMDVLWSQNLYAIMFIVDGNSLIDQCIHKNVIDIFLLRTQSITTY